MYKFEPLIKQMIWGSESWQISGVAGSETIVACGEDKGKTLNQLVKEQKEKLVGEETLIPSIFAASLAVSSLLSSFMESFRVEAISLANSLISSMLLNWIIVFCCII